MNRGLLIIASALFLNTYSQDYRPLVEEGKMWTVVDVEDSKDAERYFDFTVYRYLLRGDSVVDGHTWKRLVAVDDDGNETFLHLLREQERKVYVFDQKEKKECMIFDFGLHENDSVSLYVGVGYSGRFLDYLEEGNRISSEGLRQYGSRSHRCWEIEKSFTVTEFGEEVTITPLGRWIEGVGSEFDFLSTNYQLYYPSCICYKITVECSVNGEVIYSNVPKEIASEWEKVSVALVWNNATQDTSNNLFDLQGRKLTTEPQHGVFIKGGKKVLR